MTRSCLLSRREFTARPRLERLEDRLAPAVLQVVGTGGNGMTTFNTFAQAYAASAAPSDVIQIEPGAGDVGSIALNDPSRALTVQGDPNFATLPNQAAVDDVMIAVNNAQLLHLYGNAAIMVGAGMRGTLVNDVNLLNFLESLGTGNGGNTLQRDVIRGAVTIQGGPVSSVATNDQVLNSDFQDNAQLMIGTANAGVNGVMVSGDTFEPSSSTSLIITDSQNVTVQDTRISLTTAGDAVVIDNTLAVLPPTGLQFLRDDLRTQGGNGIHLIIGTGGQQLTLTLQGNAFQGNTTGVTLTGTADLSADSLIDAGGGGLSVGGNEFHINVTTGIVINDAGITANHLSVFADNNAVASAVTVVAVPAGSVFVSQSSQLSAQEEFIQGLYHAYLQHTGTLSELDFWVSQLASAGTQTVINSIVRSPEGLTRLVDNLYSELLGRDADPSGQQSFVTQLNAGASLEQVLVAMLASPEFATHANSLAGTPTSTASQNYVHALYLKILGRSESSAEDVFWLGILSAKGSATVAQGFVSSPEFRSKYVESLYTDYTMLPGDSIFDTIPDLLCRSVLPSTAEVNSWVNTGLDVLSIAEAISGSPEFFLNR
jgi:hypothetical protein